MAEHSIYLCIMPGGLHTDGHHSPPPLLLSCCPFTLQPENADPAAATLTKEFAFTLHSRPNSQKKIFLDFDGHTTPGPTAWSANSIVTPPYDIVSQHQLAQHTVLFYALTKCTVSTMHFAPSTGAQQLRHDLFRYAHPLLLAFLGPTDKAYRRPPLSHTLLLYVLSHLSAGRRSKHLLCNRAVQHLPDLAPCGRGLCRFRCGRHHRGACWLAKTAVGARSNWRQLLRL
jgi:hypothetical protein